MPRDLGAPGSIVVRRAWSVSTGIRKRHLPMATPGMDEKEERKRLSLRRGRESRPYLLCRVVLEVLKSAALNQAACTSEMESRDIRLVRNPFQNLHMVHVLALT